MLIEGPLGSHASTTRRPSMPAETDSTPGLAPYTLRHVVDIEHILAELHRTACLLTVQSASSPDFLLSTITQLDSRSRELFLEYREEDPANAPLSTCPGVTVETRLEGVQIRFDTGTPRPVARGQGKSWRLPWPEQIVRLQRREYYRLGTSVVHPIRCFLPTEGGLLEATVTDISVGGVAILAYEGGAVLTSGQILQGCRISLPDGGGEFMLSLRIVSTFDVKLKNGRKSHRAGCQFVNPPASVETEIQRYILKTERERRSRYI